MTYQLMKIFLIAAQLISVTQQSCPSGFESVPSSGVSNWCLKFYDTAKTFCEAVKTCHANGQEMISKAVFDAAKNSSSIDGNDKWWVGLLDAAEETYKNQSGWVWIKEGQVTTGTDVYFENSEPNNEVNQDCTNVDTPNLQIRDAGCKENHTFYCYTDTTLRTTNGDKFKFKAVPILHYNQPDPGCWVKSANVPSVFDCTITCYIFGPDCVGFYWNSARQECVILPYFDAAVPLGFDSPEEKMLWQKFLRID